MTVSQHVDRGRRARRADRARRHDVRLPRGPPGRAGPLRARPSSAGRPTPRDAGAVFDREVVVDAAALAPQVTWGTNPGQTAPITGARARAARRRTSERALDYMGLEAGTPLRGHRDRPRLHRLVHQRPPGRPARRRRGRARQARREQRAGAWSCRARWQVKAAAEAEGLDRVFTEAGFEWRNAGCSMCLGMNPDIAEPGRARAPRPPTATSRAARAAGGAHAPDVSPEMAAAAAIAGHLVDVRELELMEPFVRVTGTGRRARPRQRRHRPDHPEAVPQAHRAHGLRRVPVLGLAPQRPRLPAQPPGVRARADPRRRRQLRLGLARASTRPGRSADCGFRAIIAPSFADIFRSNCGKNGLLCVELPRPTCAS